MHFTGSGDGGDKWSTDLAAEAQHFWKRRFQRDGHVLPGHVAGGEDEFANRMQAKGAFLQQVVADMLVRGEKNPSVFPDQREPLLIGRSAGEMAQMLLVAHGEALE